MHSPVKSPPDHTAGATLRRPPRPSPFAPRPAARRSVPVSPEATPPTHLASNGTRNASPAAPSAPTTAPANTPPHAHPRGAGPASPFALARPSIPALCPLPSPAAVLAAADAAGLPSRSKDPWVATPFSAEATGASGPGAGGTPTDAPRLSRRRAWGSKHPGKHWSSSSSGGGAGSDPPRRAAVTSSHGRAGTTAIAPRPAASPVGRVTSRGGAGARGGARGAAGLASSGPQSLRAESTARAATAAAPATRAVPAARDTPAAATALAQRAAEGAPAPPRPPDSASAAPTMAVKTAAMSRGMRVDPGVAKHSIHAVEVRARRRPLDDGRSSSTAAGMRNAKVLVDMCGAHDRAVR